MWFQFQYKLHFEISLKKIKHVACRNTMGDMCTKFPPVSDGFPHKGQWRGALMFSLICAWTNGWANNLDTGDLRRHRTQYDVIVMVHSTPLPHTLRHPHPHFIPIPTITMHKVDVKNQFSGDQRVSLTIWWPHDIIKKIQYFIVFMVSCGDQRVSRLPFDDHIIKNGILCMTYVSQYDSSR